MPQMSPYNWLILMFMFNMIMIYTNSYIHFYYTPEPKKKSNNYFKNKYFWKW